MRDLLGGGVLVARLFWFAFASDPSRRGLLEHTDEQLRGGGAIAPT